MALAKVGGPGVSGDVFGRLNSLNVDVNQTETNVKEGGKFDWYNGLPMKEVLVIFKREQAALQSGEPKLIGEAARNRLEYLRRKIQRHSDLDTPSDLVGVGEYVDGPHKGEKRYVFDGTALLRESDREFHLADIREAQSLERMLSELSPAARKQLNLK